MHYRVGCREKTSLVIPELSNDLAALVDVYLVQTDASKVVLIDKSQGGPWLHKSLRQSSLGINRQSSLIVTFPPKNPSTIHHISHDW